METVLAVLISVFLFLLVFKRKLAEEIILTVITPFLSAQTRKEEESLKEDKVQFDTSKVSLLGMIVCLVALLPFPTSFYFLVRLLVFASALILVVQKYSIKKEWVFPFVPVAILYNPLLPIYLYQKELWMIANLLVAWLFWREYKITKPDS